MAGELVSPVERLMKDLYVVVAIGLGGPLDLPVFRTVLEAQLARHPYFRSIQAMDKHGTPRWVRTAVNIDDHIVVPALDAAADPEQAVEDYLAALSTLPMDHSRPPWEFHFLDVETSEAAATMALRVHHALADGMSLITLLVSSSRSAADPARLTPAPPRPPPAASAMAFVAWAWSYIVLAWHTLEDVAVFAATVLFLRDPQTMFKRASQGEVGTRMRFVHRSLSLSDVKLIKNAMNCTVNDVLVGVTSAALSRYYFRKSDDTKTRKICLRTILPVNTRPTDSLQKYVNLVESNKGEDVRWGNRLGYIILPFHLAMHDDPLEYVRKAKRIADRKKSSLEVLVTHIAMEITFKIFGVKAGAFIFNRLRANTTITFSNLIGPPEQIALCGHPVAFIAPSVYGLQQALTVHFQSYGSTIKVILAVDDEKYPDSGKLLDDFAESLRLTKDVASVTTGESMKNN